jgi:HSP20 family molecular chaperone IbpA
MSSFLDRLKKKNVIPSTPDDDKREKIAAQVAANPTPQDVALGAEQLKVDIYKTRGAIIIYAQIAGLKLEDLDVMIEGDDDVVTIRGQRVRPTGEHFQNHQTEDMEKVLEECSWGKFYRQIILPAEVDPEKTEAVMNEGVLMLLLPLREVKGAGVRIHVSKIQ